MNNMLITGINGFIGRNCSIFFRDRYNIFGIDRNSTASKNIISGSITMENLLKFNVPFQVILHFAGSGTVQEVENNPEVEREKTVESTRQLLEYVKKYNSEAIVIYSSSAAVYGNNSEEKISEEFSLNPVSMYGKIKVETEKLIQNYYESDGVHSKIIRLFSVYGEGLKKQVLWDFSKKLDSDSTDPVICYGTGEEVRDFIHIDDVMRFIDLVICDRRKFEIYNCGFGKGISINNLLHMLLATYDLNREILFSKEKQEKDPNSLIADISKAFSLGFQPKISIEAGVQRYANWFKKEN